MAAVVFWAAAVLLAQTYFLYPLWLVLLARLRPGWHDLFALTKRGAASMEGDLRPFLQYLQYFKDLLALPRLLK